MDIVGIERESFELFKQKLEKLAELSQNCTSPKYSSIETEWVEGKELACFLNVKPHYLQSLRERGKLAFSTIGKKVYYRSSDIKSLIEKGNIKSK